MMHKLYKGLYFRFWKYFYKILSNFFTLNFLCRLLQPKMEKLPEFSFRGTQLQLMFHSYNNLGLTERSLEIPLVLHFLQARTWKRVLEIGNVSCYYKSHFGNLQTQAVVDKYEKDPSVFTMDIANFADSEGFDFIFSISTFEHMDSDRGANADYVPGSSSSISVASDNIRYVYENLLRPGGTLLITAPLGYTEEWDRTFFSTDLRDFPFHEIRCSIFNRVGPTDWKEAPDRNGTSWHYDYPYVYANHVSVVEIVKAAAN